MVPEGIPGVAFDALWSIWRQCFLDGPGHDLLTLLDQAIMALGLYLRETDQAPIPPTPLVVLQGQGKPVRVRDHEKEPLTFAQYDVIEALQAAGETGLSKVMLEEKSKHGDAVNILKRLANNDPEWAAIIQLAGRPGGRYRIAVLRQWHSGHCRFH